MWEIVDLNQVYHVEPIIRNDSFSTDFELFVYLFFCSLLLDQDMLNNWNGKKRRFARACSSFSQQVFAYINLKNQIMTQSVENLTNLPSKINGIPFSWINVGVTQPSFAIAFNNRSSRFIWWNPTIFFSASMIPGSSLILLEGLSSQLM